MKPASIRMHAGDFTHKDALKLKLCFIKHKIVGGGGERTKPKKKLQKSTNSVLWLQLLVHLPALLFLPNYKRSICILNRHYLIVFEWRIRVGTLFFFYFPWEATRAKAREIVDDIKQRNATWHKPLLQTKKEEATTKKMGRYFQT